MIKMIRLKSEYQNKKVSSRDGEYDFRVLTPERLQRVYDNNPNLRHMFEEVVEISPEIIMNEEEFLKTIDEVVKKTPTKRKK